jgi:hypothetical protein
MSHYRKNYNLIFLINIIIPLLSLFFNHITKIIQKYLLIIQIFINKLYRIYIIFNL